METHFPGKVFAFVTVGLLSAILTSLVVLAVLVCRFRLRRTKKHNEVMEWRRRARRECVRAGSTSYFSDQYFSDYFSKKRSNHSSSGYSSRRTNNSCHSGKHRQMIPLLKKEPAPKPSSSLPLPTDSLPNLFHYPLHIDKNTSSKLSTFSESFQATQQSNKDQRQKRPRKLPECPSNDHLKSYHVRNKSDNTASDDLTVYSANDSGYSPTTDSKPPLSSRSDSTRNDFLLWIPAPSQHQKNQNIEAIYVS